MTVCGAAVHRFNDPLGQSPHQHTVRSQTLALLVRKKRFERFDSVSPSGNGKAAERRILLKMKTIFLSNVQ